MVTLFGSAPPGGLIIVDPEATVTIRDNDPPARLAIGDGSAEEAAGSMAFAVTVSPASGRAVSVDWATADGSATVAAGDYVAASGTLHFAPGETAKTITVAVIDDPASESDESLSVRLSNAVHAAFDDATGNGVIAANDPQVAAAGRPNIIGTLQEGQTLTAGTAEIADANGLAGVEFEYQWISNDGVADTEIEGATGVTYTLRPEDAGKTILVRVRFEDDAGFAEELTSAASEQVAAVAAGKVTNVTVVAGVDQLLVSWDEVDLAGGYKVQWTSGGQPFDATRQAVITDGATVSYTISSLTAGTAYTVQVIATRQFAPDGTPSDSVSGTPLAAAASQVSGVTVTAEVGVLAVSWNELSGAVGYKVQWKSGTQEFATARQHELTGAATVTYTIPGLTHGRTYAVRVIARLGIGDGTPSSVVETTVRAPAPAQVARVTVTAEEGQLQVSWTALSEADGYLVQWKSDGEEFDAERQGVITAGAAAGFTIPSLTAGTTYTVRVIATREHADDGPASAEVDGIPKWPPPAQVTGLTVIAEVEQLQVSWMAVSEADGYKVQWTPEGSPFDATRQAVLSGSASTSYTITSLDGGVAYTVRVIATREHADDGPASAEAEVIPRAPGLGQVTGVTVTAEVERLRVSWTAVSEADGYKVQWTSGGLLFDATRQAEVSDGAATSYTIELLEPGVPYTVRVIATLAHAADSRASALVDGIPKWPPPEAVTDVAVTASVAELQVSWTAVGEAHGYRVQWTTGGAPFGAMRQAEVSDGATTSYTIASLDAGVAYTVRVIATRDGADDGEPSVTVAGIPKWPPPGRVTGVAVVAGVERLQVSWRAVSDADAYRVQWVSGGQEFDAARQAEVSGGATASYALESLEAGVAYAVRVIAAREHADDGPASAPADATPRAPTPGQVTRVRVTAGVAELRVSWSTASGADGYTVQWTSGGRPFDAARQAEVSDGATEYTIPSLTAGTTYAVQVIATRTHAADGPASAPAEGTPEAPAAAAATPAVTIAAAADTTTETGGAATEFTVVTEGTAAEFVLSRTGSRAAALTVLVSVTEIGDVMLDAAAHDAPVEVTFAAAASTAGLTVQTNDDTTAEAAGFIFATVTPGPTATYHAGDPATAEVAVIDDDGPPDTAPPVVTIASEASEAGLPASVPFTVTIAFTERVTGLAAEEIEVTDGAAAKLDGSGDSYAVTVTPRANLEGAVTVAVPAGAASDVAGNGNVAASAEFAVDTRAPTVLDTTLSNPVEEWTEPPGSGSAAGVVDYGAVTGNLASARASAESRVLPWADGERHAVTVIFDEALDTDSTPAGDAFTVQVDGSRRLVNAVTVRGATVRLLLAEPAAAGQAVTVSYTAPAGTAATPIRDLAGNPAGDLSAGTVNGAAAAGGEPRYDRVHRALLPYAAAALLGDTLAIIGKRVDGAAAGTVPSVAATGTAADAFGPWPARAAPDPGTAALLRGAEFVLPLAAGTAGTAGTAPAAALWGAGSYRSLSGGGDAVDWSGDLTSYHVGADLRVIPELLGGVAVGWSRGAFDYTDRAAGAGALDGTYETMLLSVHPYAGWWLPAAGVGLWMSAGYGWGEVRVDDQARSAHATALRMLSGAVGASGRLLATEALIAGGTTRLRVRGEGALARVDVDDGDTIAPLALDTRRLRLLLEGSHAQSLPWGGRLTPVLEVGLRYDDGDGPRGAGLELAGELSYADPRLGLTVQGRGRWLATHQAAYDEWGAGGLLRLAPGLDRRGLSVSVAPSWGSAASGARALWERGVASGPAPAARAASAPAGRVDAEIGYGLPALGGQAVLTPYGRLALSGEQNRDYRIGSRLEMQAFSLSLEARVATSPERDSAEYGASLQARLTY